MDDVAFAAAATAAASLTSAIARAHAFGLPATLFGFTPEQPEYWQEPGLPWLTQEQLSHQEDMPLDYQDIQTILCICYMADNHMAPRFPLGCCIHTVPVYDKANLAVGRVYIYRSWDEEAKGWLYKAGRLIRIGSNYLEVKADNCPSPSRWLLSEESEQAVWDVREVTHYVSYPSEEEQASAMLLAESITPTVLAPKPSYSHK